MLQIKNLNIKTKKDRQIITNLNLNVNSNDKLAIIGEEGNGKSTLIKCIYDEKLITDYAETSGNVIRNNIRLRIFRTILR